MSPRATPRWGAGKDYDVKEFVESFEAMGIKVHVVRRSVVRRWMDLPLDARATSRAQSSAKVRTAALRYLATCGNTGDLKFARKEYAKILISTQTIGDRPKPPDKGVATLMNFSLESMGWHIISPGKYLPDHFRS